MRRSTDVLLAATIVSVAGLSYPAPPRSVPAATANDLACETVDESSLVCSIRGFYPFPAGVKAHGPMAWLFKDTHQAIFVKTACGTDRLRADFMTAGGQAHPVWWDERTKWHVLLGGDIDGEVRISNVGEVGGRSAKLERLRARLQDYDPRMNLYRNNCRIFACRVRREVERINTEDIGVDEAGRAQATMRERLADARLALGVLRAGGLPALYPMGILALCWEGLRDL